MDSNEAFAIGIDVHFVSTADGGRTKVLPAGHSVEHRYAYRPDWGLPGLRPGVLSMGFVLGFSREDIAPGDDARAVLVSVGGSSSSAWQSVRPGDSITMNEGARVCGIARVLWIESVLEPLETQDEQRFVGWLESNM